MASRIMHLAVAKKLLEEYQAKDENRFQVGVILPDVYNSPMEQDNSHFKETVCEGTKRTYNLTKLRELFGEKMKTDDLYLGYYMHLIQDLVYRRFVYKEHHWNPKLPGNVDRLHNDYALLNTYVVGRYQLTDDLQVPQGFAEEALNQRFRFDLERFLQEMKQDFEPYDKGEIFFFTEGMADTFIEIAVNVCREELKALLSGGALLDEMEYTWSSEMIVQKQ